MTEITAHHGLFRDTNLHVEDTGGSGRTVVLIHGWPLSGESWSEQVPALTEAGYRVIVYDRRGFGRSDKPVASMYNYNTLTKDLHTVITELEAFDVTLVGFSMGGGEVARYVAEYGQDRLHSVVFASAITPYLLHTSDNPEGPLEPTAAAAMTASLTANQDAFYDDFVVQFFSVAGELKVSELQRQQARDLCRMADKNAALQCMAAWGNTDFRADLKAITVPTLVIHGDGDGTVPLDGSARRTHQAIPDSKLVVLHGAPHGCNVSHAETFNRALLEFLER